MSIEREAKTPTRVSPSTCLHHRKGNQQVKCHFTVEVKLNKENR